VIALAGASSPHPPLPLELGRLQLELFSDKPDYPRKRERSRGANP